MQVLLPAGLAVLRRNSFETSSQCLPQAENAVEQQEWMQMLQGVIACLLNGAVEHGSLATRPVRPTHSRTYVLLQAVGPGCGGELGVLGRCSVQKRPSGAASAEVGTCALSITPPLTPSLPGRRPRCAPPAASAARSTPSAWQTPPWAPGPWPPLCPAAPPSRATASTPPLQPCRPSTRAPCLRQRQGWWPVQWQAWRWGAARHPHLRPPPAPAPAAAAEGRWRHCGGCRATRRAATAERLTLTGPASTWAYSCALSAAGCTGAWGCTSARRVGGAGDGGAGCTDQQGGGWRCAASGRRLLSSHPLPLPSLTYMHLPPPAGSLHHAGHPGLGVGAPPWQSCLPPCLTRVYSPPPFFPTAGSLHHAGHPGLGAPRGGPPPAAGQRVWKRGVGGRTGGPRRP